MSEYDDLIKLAATLDDATVPYENRTLIVNKQTFLDLGGTEEEWNQAQAY